VIGTRTHNPHADPVALVPAGEAIDDIDAIPGIEIINCSFAVDAPDLIEQC
jgi:hypothetical protein